MIFTTILVSKASLGSSRNSFRFVTVTAGLQRSCPWQLKDKEAKMAVEAVKIEADAYMVCLTHALTTEREEVMGLLIGEVLFSYYVKFLGFATFKT